MNSNWKTDLLDLPKFHTRILCYVYGIFSYMYIIGDLPASINNIDTARTGPSEVMLSNQVMKCADPAYPDFASFSERATVT